MTFYYVIFKKHSYTRENTQLHSLISYVLLMQPAQCVYCVECGIRSHGCMTGEGVEWEVGLYDSKNGSACQARECSQYL